MKKFVLGLIMAAALSLPAIGVHAAGQNNNNNGGQGQNGHCQNGYYEPAVGHCINNK
ncbi:MAG: hypothetical protein JOZ41_01375 [Chloroflexi bacterium]|nr:hypothetical protein [Chloroflexota bacterium]